MSTKKNKHLSRLVGLYLTGAVICSGMAYDMTAVEAATNFEQQIASTLQGQTGAANIVINQRLDSNGNVQYYASLDIGGIISEVVTSTNPAEKTVDISSLGLENFNGPSLTIDSKVEGVKLSGDTGTVSSEVTIKSDKPIEVTGDVTLDTDKLKVDKNTELNVTGGTLTVANPDSTEVGQVTLGAGGTVTTQGAGTLKAESLTVDGGTLQAPVEATGAVEIKNGMVGGDVKGSTVTVADGTITGAITGTQSVAVNGGTVSGKVEANTVTLSGGTVSGAIKADAVTLDGATVNTNAEIKTNNVTVGSRNTVAVENIKVTAEAGKTVELNGLSTEDAKKVLENLTTVDKNGQATGDTVDVVIKDENGVDYNATVTTKPGGGAADVTEPQPMKTMDALNNALKNTTGNVSIGLNKNADGTTTILLKNGDGTESQVKTNTDAKTINLADLVLPKEVSKLTVDTGNISDAIEISGGSLDIPVELTGSTAAKLTIGAGVTADNLTISNTGGVTVTAGDRVSLGTLTVADGATVTAAKDSKVVKANSVAVGSKATLEGTLETSSVTVQKDSNLGKAKFKPVAGNLEIIAPDQATSEKLIKENVVLSDKDEITVKDDRGTTTYNPELNSDGTIKDLGKGETVSNTPGEAINKYLSEKGLSSTGDPFVVKLPSQSDMNAIKKEIDDLKVAGSDKVYQEFHQQVVKTAMVGATPAVGAVQANYAVANVAINNVADRLNERRSEQPGYVLRVSDNVKGAYDGKQSNLWASIKHGKTDIDNSDYGTAKVDYTYYQLGYDHQVSDTFYLGGYIGGTTGDVETAGMSTDIDKAYDIGLYGTRLLPEGQYVNILGRYGKMTNKYRTMDWDTDSYGLTLEYGQKLQHAGGFTVTPYVQMSYGHMSSDTAMVGVNRLSMDDAKNLTTKIGAKFEEKDDDGNSVYGGLSYLWGMSGDYKMYMNGISLPKVENDLGVLTVNIGIKRRMGDTSYFNLALEKEMMDYDGWNVQGGLNFTF